MDFFRKSKGSFILKEQPLFAHQWRSPQYYVDHLSLTSEQREALRDAFPQVLLSFHAMALRAHHRMATNQTFAAFRTRVVPRSGFRGTLSVPYATGALSLPSVVRHCFSQGGYTHTSQIVVFGVCLFSSRRISTSVYTTAL